MNKQIKAPIILFLTVLSVGTLGYKALLGDQISLFDSLYMTVITISSVGFTEVVDLSGKPLVRAFTIFILLVGMGNLLFIVSTITSTLVDGNLNATLRRHRMLKKIKKFSNHVIVCGIGRVGLYMVEEMYHNLSCNIVVIDNNDEIAVTIKERFPKIHVVTGDAMDDDLLLCVGIEKAQALITVLPDDKDNIFVVMAARQLNPGLRIIARFRHPQNQIKLQRAGATQTLSPSKIGGHHLATMLLKPTIVDFVDNLMHSRSNVRIEEIDIPEGSWIVGKTLSELQIPNELGLQIIGAKEDESARYSYCPSGEYEVKANAKLVCIGSDDKLDELSTFIKK